MIIEWATRATPVPGVIEIGRVIDPPSPEVPLPTRDTEFMERTQRELEALGWLGEPSEDTFLAYDFIAAPNPPTLKRPGRIEVGTASPWHHDGKFVSAGVVMVGSHDRALCTVFSGPPDLLPFDCRYQGEPWTLYSQSRFTIHRGVEVVRPNRALYRWARNFCQPRAC
jgi:hypothetical protein